ncbi:phosphoenolpyruvate synthase [Neofamilia massiliensis]|uniref:phosphoenolpyruvate synthase n=1 Tax=Neofamilia massiliensis TaxID=1673724 RepID=UPI0006BB8C93|nr:phosphoenolpyruvate synthase [Neofamilia massiliensis]
MSKYRYIRKFNEVGKDDIGLVGGKGANLGEMTQMGLDVPPGFCVTSTAYNYFIEYTNLDETVKVLLERLDVDNPDSLTQVSEKLQAKLNESKIPEDLEAEIRAAYNEFSKDVNLNNPQVAVRSSATAEDLPDASFAGQQDTYLHIAGEEELLKHIRMCWASLWTARAIYYREKQKFDHFDVALSVVVQKMVNSEKSGVMFTANPISQNIDEMMINASYGLGEAVVSGMVTPDEYIINKNTKEIIETTISEKNVMVIKADDGIGTRIVNVADFLGNGAVENECLSTNELNKLIDYGLKIEKSYNSIQDIEWGIDEDTNDLYILQSRPITTIKPDEKEELIVLAKGLAASPGLGRGKVRIVEDLNNINQVKDGDVLITGMTNPDMVPAMRKCAAVVTEEGGRTCHAAIVSRELGIPCIVGAKNAMKNLKEGQFVTVDSTRGVVYDGNVLNKKVEDHKKEEGSANLVMTQELKTLLAPVTATKIYMNLGQPDLIDKHKHLPFDGIGLMRTEFIFTNMIGVHPMYLVKTGQTDLMVDKLVEGIYQVASAIYPKQLTVRLSDFRTNEYRGLKGGEEVEPIEQNPMIGWRGVSRYISPEYEQGFRLECQAIKKVREEHGLKNVVVMLPFVRTPEELIHAKKIMAEEGLVQGVDFKLWIMAEVPSVVMQAEEFAQLVDGFSIGSNDLTQLIMGSDRDSEKLNNMGYFDERNEAVKRAVKILINAAKKYGKTCSICGQGPSQYPEFAEFLVENGITSISVNPDTVEYTRRVVAQVEQKLILNSIKK